MVKKNIRIARVFKYRKPILFRGLNSKLGESLKVSGIPRYVIFDKQEKIRLGHAPRPSDSIVFKRVIDDINLSE